MKITLRNSCVVLVCAAIAACSLEEVSMTAQEVCTVEDQNAGECVTPYWIAARTATAQHSGQDESRVSCSAWERTLVHCTVGWWQSDIYGNYTCRTISCDDDRGEVSCDVILTSDDSHGECD